MLANDLGKFLAHLCLGFVTTCLTGGFLSVKWGLMSHRYSTVLVSPPPPSREKHDWKSLGREAAAEKGKKWRGWRGQQATQTVSITIIFHGSISIKIVLSVSLRLKISRTSNNSRGVLVFLLLISFFFFFCQH